SRCVASYVAEADELPALLVPKREARALEAPGDRQPAHRLQLRAALEAFLKPVIRDHAIEMVNVMEADAAAEPSQQARKDEIRAAMNRGALKIPVLLPRPIGVFELMLDVEHPAADPRRDHDHRQVGHQQGF